MHASIFLTSTISIYAKYSHILKIILDFLLYIFDVINNTNLAGIFYKILYIYIYIYIYTIEIFINRVLNVFNFLMLKKIFNFILTHNFGAQRINRQSL